ncbi:MAG: PorV/PorQ family protein [candidate division KSB1 bacterium]|nr:PorV/PorQ family protein [candidate division KSB1 bacterium]MDZ7302083.1 PorV/PorQ family protein [candidate division KSB1 bacterium]MDZ7311124.1 PorV/PorQ family protein [candidate division KSB1 bacterium]
MSLIKRMIAALVVVLMTASLGSGQVKKTGYTGAAFLKVGVGARAVALGSAVTSLTGDVNQMFWNPAGITLSNNQWQATFTYNKWIADINHTAAAIAHDFGSIGTFGIGFISFGLSGIAADRDVVPGFLLATFKPYDTSTSSTYDYMDLAFQLTYARNFTDKLALGMTVKVINQSIDEESATTFAFDFGSTYKIGFHNATIGARINNLGKDLKFFDIGTPLPLNFSVGGSIDLFNKADHRITILADATKPQDADQLVFAGGEYMFNDLVAVRGGWKFNYSGVDDKKRNEYDQREIKAPRTEEGVTLGGGVKVGTGTKKLMLDYSFTEFGLLDNTHRFSLNVTF